jgi:hypothetical protein
MVDDAVAMEAVAARVADEALHSPGLLLGGPAEQVVGGETSPAPPRDGDREAAVAGVDHVPDRVGPHGVADLAVRGLVLPGDQPPGSDQCVAGLHLVHGDLPGAGPSKP